MSRRVLETAGLIAALSTTACSLFVDDFDGLRPYDRDAANDTPFDRANSGRSSDADVDVDVDGPMNTVDVAAPRDVRDAGGSMGDVARDTVLDGIGDGVKDSSIDDSSMEDVAVREAGLIDGSESSTDTGGGSPGDSGAREGGLPDVFGGGPDGSTTKVTGEFVSTLVAKRVGGVRMQGYFKWSGPSQASPAGSVIVKGGFQ